MLIRAKVDFRKPDFAELRNNGMTCVDMHFHSRYSDTYTKVDKILKRAEKLGIGVSITDHNGIGGCLEAFRKKDDQLIIPGIEVHSAERCHFLFYFYKVSELKEFYYRCVEPFKNKNPYTMTTAKAVWLMKQAQHYDCISCAPHPFMPGFLGLYKNIIRGYIDKQILEPIDAIEVINGVNRRKANWKGLEWAEKINTGFTGGSDGHSLFQLGKVVTCAKAKTVKEFLDAIKLRNNFVIGKEIGLVRQIPSHQKVIRRHLRYIRPTIKLRYEATLKPSIRYHVPIIKEQLNHAKDIGIDRVKDIGKRTRKRIDYKFERV